MTTIEPWKLKQALPHEWFDLSIISGTWGSSFLFVKLISPSVPPFAFAAERGFIAMAALLAWLAVRSPPEPRANAMGRISTGSVLGSIVVLGTTNGWLANVLTVLAVRHVDSAVVAMSLAAVPLMVAVLAHFLFAEEQFDVRQLTGILIGLAGIFLIVGPLAIFGGTGSFAGIAATILTAFSYACGTVYGRRAAAIDSAVLACGQQAFGGLVAAVISSLGETHSVWSQSAGVWFLLTIVGVFCSAVPTLLYLRLLARTTSVVASLVAYLQPVWAMLLGWAVLGERISVAALFGTGLVFIATAVTTERPFR